jgi:hypothetical protein
MCANIGPTKTRFATDRIGMKLGARSDDHRPPHEI